MGLGESHSQGGISRLSSAGVKAPASGFNGEQTSPIYGEVLTLSLRVSGEAFLRGLPRAARFPLPRRPLVVPVTAEAPSGLESTTFVAAGGSESAEVGEGPSND